MPTENKFATRTHSQEHLDRASEPVVHLDHHRPEATARQEQITGLLCVAPSANRGETRHAKAQRRDDRLAC